MPRRDDCHKGLHQYTRSTLIGAGIRRDHCERCGAVRIDLAGEVEMSDVSNVFAGAPRREVVTESATESDLLSLGTFGQARHR